MNLVMSAVGKKGIHNQWLNGDYDVVLFHYEEQGKNYKEGRVTHVFKEGFKFPLIKEYLETINIEDYKYYLFLDDDMFINPEQIERLFIIADDYNLNIFHPAMARYNENGLWGVCEPDVLFKYQNVIDINAVGMAWHKVKDLLHTFDINKSGWGLVELWKKQYSEYQQKVLISLIDDVEVIHTRPYKDGAIYKNLGGMDKAEQELKDLQIKYDIKKPEYKIFQRFYKKPLLSTLTIFCDKDKDFLPELEKTLPSWAEHIYLHTIPIDEDTALNEGFIHNKIVNIESNGLNTIAEYHYRGEFDFAEAMNAAKSLSKGTFVMKLDADERLLTHQHINLFSELDRIKNNYKIGAVVMQLVASYKDKTTIVSPQVRIIRNIDEIKWEGKAHEQPDYSLERNNFDIITSSFKIDHIGYEVEDDEMENKMIRNIKKMILEPELLKDNRHFNLLVRDCYHLFKSQNERKL